MLYPLKFHPIYKEKIWGGNRLHTYLGKEIPSDQTGESWEISTVPGNISVVKNGELQENDLLELIEVYMGDLVGDAVYEKFGNEFPLLIKYIDADDVLSVQVHPGDELAKERHESFGKSEMWYIIDHEPSAYIINGFEHDTDKKQYQFNLAAGTIEQLLKQIPVAPGDAFYIPAGRIHAIGAGILLAEIQQTSDITYRVYDFNRTDDKGQMRELHTDLALDALDFFAPKNIKSEYKNIANQAQQVVKSPYFQTNNLIVNKPLGKDFNHIDSFVIYMCLRGEVVFSAEDFEDVSMRKGDTILMPAIMKSFQITPKTEAHLLEVFIPEPEPVKK